MENINCAVKNEFSEGLMIILQNTKTTSHLMYLNSFCIDGEVQLLVSDMLNGKLMLLPMRNDMYKMDSAYLREQRLKYWGIEK